MARRRWSLTASNDNAHAPSFERSHRFHIVTVVPSIPHYRPSGCFPGYSSIQRRPLIHAAADDCFPIRARGQAQNVLIVTLDSLGLRKRLAVPYAYLTGRVSGDDVAVDQTLHRPDNDIFGSSRQIPP